MKSSNLIQFALIATLPFCCSVLLAADMSSTTTGTTSTTTMTPSTTATPPDNIAPTNVTNTETTGMSNPQINSDVQNKITNDAALKNSGITATTTTDGTVKLQGHVETQEQATQAINDAKSVSGVNNVDTSNLTVGSTTSGSVPGTMPSSSSGTNNNTSSY